ncbi:MAG: hypothetical protein AAGB01_04585 [Cyanobacteria bacterium P01_F01_bin.42]
MTTHNPPWHYWAYGLYLKSEIEIPCLLPWRDELMTTLQSPDPVWVQVVSAEAVEQRIPPDVAEQKFAVQVTNGEITIYLRDLATFFIREGAHVTCVPSPKAAQQQLTLALAGVAMAGVLFQKGYLVAHGSAVAVGNEAALFLGNSGAGKSSLAIALQQRGHSVLTDDLAVITFDQETPHLLPAFPHLRIPVQTAAALNLDWSSLMALPETDKRGMALREQFVPQAIPLRHAYVLQAGASPLIQRLPGHQALMELMHHSEVMGLLFQSPARHFQACAPLAQHIPISAFQRPLDWAQITDVLDYFEAQWDDRSPSSL